MITFTDKRLYVKGTCSAILSDKNTGDIVYFSDKFQTGNMTTSVTTGEIRAGLGNGIATIIPSDSALNVEFAAADFNLFAKMAQVGGTLNYNAPAMTCQIVEASSGTLTIDVTGGDPVAQLGFSDVFCYVQEVGASSPISIYGKSYLISSAGEVTGFTATSGKKYKVWYCVNQASAQVGAVPSFIDPATYHFTAQMAVYMNATGTASNNTGSRCGWLYVIVPSLKLAGIGGGVVGDQSTNDTTSISGMATIADSDVVSENCESCGGGNIYAYYVYVPDNAAESIEGLAIVGGLITLNASAKAQVPVKYVMANGELVTPNYTDLSYELTTPISGASVSEAGVITAGANSGDGEVTVTYDKVSPALTCVANVSVVGGGGG